MNLIMESWRSSLIKEVTELNTVGDLRKTIQDYRLSKAGKEVGKKALEATIEQIPGLNNLFSIWKATKDTKEMFQSLYGADDKIKSNSGLDALNIDDNVSKIVDDEIETAFLNYLMKKIESMDDNDPIPNSNEELQTFLKSKFDNNTVKK